MKNFELIDDIIKEPLGGAHTFPEEMASILKEHLIHIIRQLMAMDPNQRISERINKFSSMGRYKH